MFRNKSVRTHDFSMIPRADIPRSTFRIEKAHKTTFDAGLLIPVYVDEVLPGDTFNLNMTSFARMATPLFPLMDNLHLDTFWFFIPNRLVWDNWVKFMGEQDSPGDSISYVIPQCVSPVGGFAVNSVFDYMGLPTVGQVGGAATVSVNALFLRAYNLVFHEWFRDENLQNSYRPSKGDGPDLSSAYTLLRRGKRHDYFTSALPWPQKGNTAVSLPLGTSAPIRSTGLAITMDQVTPGGGTNIKLSALAANSTMQNQSALTGSGFLTFGAIGNQQQSLFADLSQATAATINQLRQAFQIQKLLERDARGGTRYTEIVRQHFGVISPDSRLQRPEYLGGSSSPINVNPIAQTAGTGASGSTTPLGQLGAMATVVSRSGFHQSFTEHGMILGLVSVRADLTYQQGMRKMWSRSTRYDYYFPAFSHLGEQAVLNREIYCDGSANDANVFGYQERWAEYRYNPSMITGLFRSTSAGTIDPWHAAQRFMTLPALNATFIADTPPISRLVAVGAAANGQQFLFDSVTVNKAARPMPMYSVPGLIDHF